MSTPPRKTTLQRRNMVQEICTHAEVLSQGQYHPSFETVWKSFSGRRGQFDYLSIINHVTTKSLMPEENHLDDAENTRIREMLVNHYVHDVAEQQIVNDEEWKPRLPKRAFSEINQEPVQMEDIKQEPIQMEERDVIMDFEPPSMPVLRPIKQEPIEDDVKDIVEADRRPVIRTTRRIPLVFDQPALPKPDPRGLAPAPADKKEESGAPVDPALFTLSPRVLRDATAGGAIQYRTGFVGYNSRILSFTFPGWFTREEQQPENEEQRFERDMEIARQRSLAEIVKPEPQTPPPPAIRRRMHIEVPTSTSRPAEAAIRRGRMLEEEAQRRMPTLTVAEIEAQARPQHVHGRTPTLTVAEIAVQASQPAHQHVRRRRAVAEIEDSSFDQIPDTDFPVTRFDSNGRPMTELDRRRPEAEDDTDFHISSDEDSADEDFDLDMSLQRILEESSTSTRTPSNIGSLYGECKICLDDHVELFPVTICCSHKFCRSCIQSMFQKSATGDHPACPTCSIRPSVDLHEALNSGIPLDSIRYLDPLCINAVDSTLCKGKHMMPFINRCFLAGAEVDMVKVCCPKCETVTCGSTIYNDPKCSRCPNVKCALLFCSGCFQPYHSQDIPCQVKENEETTKYLAKSGRKCPVSGCKGFFQHFRNHGCHHMRCPICKTEICYACGQTKSECDKGRRWGSRLSACPVFCNDRCHCLDCEDCKPGHPCSTCVTGCNMCVVPSSSTKAIK